MDNNNVMNEEIMNEFDEDEIELYPANNTLYINNLNERVRISDLKTALFHIFSQFGEIADIIAKTNAFIIFEKQESAENALKEMQLKFIFDKKMRINYAKEKSDVISKRDGDFVPKDKRVKVPQITKKIKKKQKMEEQNAYIGGSYGIFGQKNPPQGAKTTTIVPNNILFIENLIPEVTQEVLMKYFSSYPGFREVRLITAKNVAFVEYDEEFQAGIALGDLAGQQIMPEYTLQITYAKK